MTKTYKDLLNKLNNMNEAQLNSDITILDNDNEYHRATLLFTDEQTCDILDNGHPVIVGFGKREIPSEWITRTMNPE